MEDIRNILDSINKYEKAKAVVDDYDKFVERSAAEAAKEVAAVLGRLKTSLSGENFRKLFGIVLSINKGKMTYDRASGFIYIGGKAPSLPFDCNNYKRVVDEVGARLKKPLSSPTIAVDFTVGYNTAMRLFAEENSIVDSLKSALVEQTKNDYEQAKTFIGQFQSSPLYLNKGVPRKVDDPHGEGVIILGYEEQPFTEEEKKKLREYGFCDEHFASPIKLDISSGACAVVEADETANSLNMAGDFLKSVFYDNFTYYAPGDLSLITIEKNRTSYNSLLLLTSDLRAVSAEKPEFPDYTYTAIDDDNGGDAAYVKASAYDTINTTAQAAAVLASVQAEIKNRETLLQGYRDIKEYNEKNVYNTLRYVFVLINGYPNDLYRRDYSGAADKFVGSLEWIMEKEKARLGIFVLIVGEQVVVTDDVYGERREVVNTNVFKKYALTLSLSGDPSIKLSSGVTNETRLKKCDEIIEKARSNGVLLLDEMLSTCHFSKPDSGTEYCIPIGLSDGKPYVFAHSVVNIASKMKGGTNTLVLGGTGKGKTAFLREFILSGAYYYTPEELQFYIVDFKATTGSADFSCFLQANARSNAYVPHVKFLSMESGPEHAVQVVQLIQRMIGERGTIFTANECNDYVSYYNKCKSDKSLKPMPMVCFLIDEFNNIFDKTKLGAALNNCLNKVRSYGISIILSGQSMPSTVDYNSVENRIVFSMSDFYSFKGGFNDVEDEERKSTKRAYSLISGKVGVAACARNPKSAEKQVVRFAFDGGGKARNAIARKIREKYSDERFRNLQLTPGSDDKNSADNLLKTDENDIRFKVGLTYYFYVGLSSLISTPIAVKFGKKPDAEMTSATDYPFYRNYYAWLGIEKQQYLEAALILAYCAYLKDNGAVGGGYISFNYKEREKADYVLDVLKGRLPSRLVKINDNLADVLDEIDHAYEIFSERASVEEENPTPYLLVLHNATWISRYHENVERLNGETNEETENFSDDPFDIEGLTEEQKAQMKQLMAENFSDGDDLGEIKADAERFFAMKNGKDNASRENKKYDTSTLDKLKIIMESGGERNVFALVLSESFYGFGALGDISGRREKIVERNDEVSSEQKKVKNNCFYVGEYETRVFDYKDAPQWHEKYDD